MNPAPLFVFLPMIFGSPYQPPLVAKIETMIPHQQPLELPVCQGCVLVQDDESKIYTSDITIFKRISESEEITVTLINGERAIYGLMPLAPVELGISDDLPDLWIKTWQVPSQTLHYHIKQ